MRAHWDLCPSPAAGGEGDPPVGGPAGGGWGQRDPGGRGCWGQSLPRNLDGPSPFPSTFYVLRLHGTETPNGTGETKKTNISKENFDIFSYF